MALATLTTDPAFKAEALTFDDVRQSTDRTRDLAKHAFVRLRKIGAKTSDDIRAGAERLLARCQECFSLIDALEREPEGAIKIRIHGDYRLSLLLVVKDDIFIVDFGEGPSTSPDHRRIKTSPLRDVAVMLHSFAHAISAAKRDVAGRPPDTTLAAARLRKELVEFSRTSSNLYGYGARQPGLDRG